MSRTVENIIKNDCESQVLDFKREPYQLGKNPKKYELLKDFCAFVNNPSNLDKYIIIGVNEHEGRALSFRTVNNDVDEAGYQQYIYQNIEPPITFEYKSFQYQSYTLSYFRIFNNTKRPYLFKSDIKDPITNKLLFRIGDGLIRRGTSTERLTRNDFEEIYAARYKDIDRKSDLVITCYIEKSKEEIISNFNLDFIDVKVENMSTKSIGFDIELRIKKSKNLVVLTMFDAKTELRKIQHKANQMPTGSISGPLYYPDLNPLNISIDDTEDHFIASKIMLRDKTNSVILGQKSKDESIFNKEIIIYAQAPVTVSGEIILKSDSFTEGPLIKEFSLSIEKSF